MGEINITSAQYVVDSDGVQSCIEATIDGMRYLVPVCVGNSHYDEIQRQVAAGTLTIQEAD